MNNAAKQVLDYINNNLQGYDAVYISNQKLSDELKLSKKTIITSMNYILDNNLLEYYPIGQNSKAYCSPESEPKSYPVCKMIL